MISAVCVHLRSVYIEGTVIKMVSKVQVPQHSRTFPGRCTQVLPHGDHWGNLQGSTTGDLIETEKRGAGLTATCAQILAVCITAYSNTWAEISARLCPSAELSQWPHLARELSWQFYLIWVPNQQALLTTEPVLWPHLGKEANSQPHLIYEHSLQSCPTRKPSQSWSPETDPSLWPCLITEYKLLPGTSLVTQWLRIHLPMQGTRVRALVREGPTCPGATKPMCHNYWACALEPVRHNYWAWVPRLLSPHA